MSLRKLQNCFPGIEYLTNQNLEGNATQQSFKLVQSTANDIARATLGAVLDPQDDSVRLPSGVKRFASPKREEVFDVVALSWWFLDSPLLTRNGQECFVALLERMLPEALPKRYGLYEPPQNVYAETGRARFLQFLEEKLHDMKVWYPHRPVASVYISAPDPWGAHQLGFRTGRLEIEIEKSALSQPGWDAP